MNVNFKSMSETEEGRCCRINFLQFFSDIVNDIILFYLITTENCYDYIFENINTNIKLVNIPYPSPLKEPQIVKQVP